MEELYQTINILDMEVKRFKIRLIAIALAMPMLFVACNSDEPSSSETRSTDSPIIFETKGMEWQTTYDDIQNIYHTSLAVGKISYIIKKGECVPDGFVVTKLVKNEDGKLENIDVSHIISLAKTGDGFYKADTGDISFNYSQKGELIVELKSVDNLNEPAKYKNRYYIIDIQNTDGTLKTTIIINDLHSFFWGQFPMDIELSKIGYPVQRSYNEWTGHYKGFDYTIELPSDECVIPLISIDCATHMNIHNFTITDVTTGNFIEEKTPYFADSAHFPAEYSFSTQCGDFLYNKIRHEYIDVETEEIKEYYECNLLCKIDANPTNSAREIAFEIKDGCYLAKIKFIQAEK